jgi:hypothetical protein
MKTKDRNLERTLRTHFYLAPLPLLSRQEPPEGRDLSGHGGAVEKRGRSAAASSRTPSPATPKMALCAPKDFFTERTQTRLKTKDLSRNEPKRTHRTKPIVTWNELILWKIGRILALSVECAENKRDTMEFGFVFASWGLFRNWQEFLAETARPGGHFVCASPEPQNCGHFFGTKSKSV